MNDTRGSLIQFIAETLLVAIAQQAIQLIAKTLLVAFCLKNNFRQLVLRNRCLMRDLLKDGVQLTAFS